MSQADLTAILECALGPVSHDGYGWDDKFSADSPVESAFQRQSFDVNPEYLGKRIVLPGFIVPTAYNEEREVTEFFLVPFFGACIHVPPPPPNQIAPFMLPLSKGFSWTICMTLIISWESFLATLCDMNWQTLPTA